MKQLTIDSVNETVTVNGKTIYLTKKEYALLRILYKNKGALVTKEQLVKIWGNNLYQPHLIIRSINVYATKLRKILGLNYIIESVHGKGYILIELETDFYTTKVTKRSTLYPVEIMVHDFGKETTVTTDFLNRTVTKRINNETVQQLALEGDMLNTELYHMYLLRIQDEILNNN